MAETSSGRFITFEGGEGGGKSSQMRLLAERLQGNGREIVMTREPGGSPGAEAIRKLLVQGSTERWEPTTEALLHFAARRDHLVRVIWPALERGAVVLSDRFADSTTVYQGHAQGFDLEKIGALYRLVVGEFKPDLTLILDLPVEIGLARAAARRGNEARYESFGNDFHQKVRSGFLAIAAAEPRRCAVIDASADIDTVARQIAEMVKARVGV